MPKKKPKSRTHCIRCGTCCVKGGPTLHKEDAVLLAKSILTEKDVYTLRKGEVVRDLDDRLIELKNEIVKIKGKRDTWTCLFFDGDHKACTIYRDRPLECRALKCWDLSEFQQALAKPHLQRHDVLDGNDGLLKLITTHETRCGYHILKAAAQAAEGPDLQAGVEQILDLLRYDDFMRPFLMGKLSLDPAAMDFFFGRPLAKTIGMFGLHVQQQGDTYTLVPVEPQHNIA